jgi:hypothetical protein
LRYDDFILKSRFNRYEIQATLRNNFQVKIPHLIAEGSTEDFYG